MGDYLKALTNAVAIEMLMGWGRWNLQCCMLSVVRFREKLQRIKGNLRLRDMVDMGFSSI